MNIPYEKSFASHAKSKFWSNKNILKPNEVYRNTIKKYYFNCDKCTHEFNSCLSSISGGTWCPYCTSQKLCDNENCKECFNKSFASHPKSKCWSNKNLLTPRQVFKSSNKKYYLNCHNCNHEFNPFLNCVKTDSDCPFCTSVMLCYNEDCKECFNNSFASHYKSKFWSDTNKLKPRNVFIQSNSKYFFNCEECNHIFGSRLTHVYNEKWCSFCASLKLCDNNNCSICYNKSFKSHIKSEYWSKKNTLTPRQVFKSTAKEYLFDCEKCKLEFSKRLYSITNGNSWCPICRRKTEYKLFEYLKTIFNNVEREVKFSWSKTEKSYRKYDFYIKEIKLLVELDGNQHFIQISNWNSPEENKLNDDLKN